MQVKGKVRAVIAVLLSPVLIFGYPCWVFLDFMADKAVAKEIAVEYFKYIKREWSRQPPTPGDT
jgi:hypothetical protein